jgi:hypothetical protein
MLERMSRVARPVYRYRAAIWALFAAALGVFVVSLFGVADSQGVVLASLVTLIWAMLLIAFGHCFSAPAPVAAPDAGWLTRLRVRVARALLGLLAIAAIAAFGLVALLTIRAASLLVGRI